MYRILLLLLLAMPARAQDDEDDNHPFPPVIMPQKIAFQMLPEDSVINVPPPAMIDSAMQYVSLFVRAYSFDGDDSAYILLLPDNNVYLAARVDGRWLVTTRWIDVNFMNTTYSLEHVNLDDSGHKEILLYAGYPFSKGGRYYNYDSHVLKYTLLNLDKQEIIYNAETYRNESLEYTGYKMEDAGEDAKEEDLNREEAEAAKEENRKITIDNDYHEIRIVPGKLIIENIDYHPYVPEGEKRITYGLDTIKTIEYLLKDGKLVRQ